MTAGGGWWQVIAVTRKQIVNKQRSNYSYSVIIVIEYKPYKPLQYSRQKNKNVHEWL